MSVIHRSSSIPIRSYRLILGILILLSILFLVMPAYATSGSLARTLTYFTIQSNLIAAAVLLWNAVRPPAEGNALRRDLFRGAAVLYLAITGIVYAVLLSGFNAQVEGVIAWANLVLHYVAPLAVFVDWFLVPPSPGVTFWRALVWLVYPLAYLAYSLVRGAILDWYPYAFLDPGIVGGYGGVAAFALVVLAGGLVFSGFLVAGGRWAGRW